MKLSLDSTPSGVAAALVALVAGFNADTLQVVPGAAALDFDGTSGSVSTVLSALVAKRHRSDLDGASDAERKQVADWFAILGEVGSAPNQAFLERLNSHLLASSFLAASSFQPTVVDYAAWAIVHQFLSTLSSGESAKLPNLTRWARYIVASIPRTAATAAWVKVPLTSAELPAELASKIAEMDLAAAMATDNKPRAALVAVAKPGAAVPLASAPTAAKSAAAAPAAASVAVAAPAAAAAAAPAKEKKEKAPKEAKAAKPAAAAVAEVAQVYRVDFRVGKMLSVEKHPSEARLLVEQIDVGEDKPRTVVSGLAEFFTPEQLTGQMVVVMVNLKAGDMKGVVSNGRVMVATGADGKTKELATPPAAAKVGERITFATVPADKKPDEELAAKKLHDILKGLHTNAAKVVQYQEADFQTTAGPVTVATVADGTVA